MSARSMKILHAISGREVGVAEIAFERAVLAFASEDIEQRIIIRADDGRRARLKNAGLHPIELPFRPRWDFSSKRQLNTEISAFQPDIVLTWTADVTEQIQPSLGKHLAFVSQDFPVNISSKCDHLFANSKARVDQVTSSGWPKRRMSLLPPIISNDHNKPINRKTLFTPVNAKLVVAVGSLDTENNFRTLLEAIARISGLYLWILGEGTALATLEERAVEIGIKPRSRFLGWRYDALSLIAAADLVVCPTDQDDLGIGVTTAWSCGKPVIATDSMADGTLIRHRENGVLVPANDTRSLAEVIKWVMQDHSFSERIAAAGLDKFEVSHDKNSSIPRYLDLFQQLVEGRGPLSSQQL